MNDRYLKQQLDRVAARFRRWNLGVCLTVVWLLAGGIAVAMLWMRQSGMLSRQLPLALLLAGIVVAVIGCLWLSRKLAGDHARIARRLERHFADLNSTLCTAVELQPDLPNGQFGYLQESVLQQALLHHHRHNWQSVVPNSRLVLVGIVQGIALAGLIAAVVGFALLPGPTPAQASSSSDDLSRAAQQVPLEVTVEPGNTSIEIGTALLVEARFKGDVPVEATLVVESEEGQFERMPMRQSLSDPVFSGRVAVVDRPLRYFVEFADQQTERYRVDVFSYPQLERADAKLDFPGYTGMEPRLVQDTRLITAVVGTQVTLTCHLNKPVDAAALRPDGDSGAGDSSTISLAQVETESTAYQATLTLSESRRFRLHLVDEAARTNREPPLFILKVLPNRPPDLKLAKPTRDVQVSPLEELDLQASAWDDYGLERVGINFTIPGTQPQTILLGEKLPGKERVTFDHRLDFEALSAQPDQLLAYHFWAEDVGPDGQTRRTSSDMYFAEVRHFEEIFRQGQQPPGGQQQQQQQQQGQGPNAQQAQQLAELQKQIINGTWTLIRREIRESVSDKFLDDVNLLRESQQQALAQAATLAEKLQDGQSMAHIASVQEQMNSAETHLNAAGEGLSPEPLELALAAEQAAYQSLLRLRAREHEVIRQQQQQSGQSSQSRNSQNRSQQQLQQLQLKNDTNRYEQQRLAQETQDNPQQREDRQVLNRLRELARRQADVNQRVKELQSQLEAAQTEEEKEEIRRQLKRLQDEQQQILRDSDELKSRMEQPENLERMAQERQQLEQARENARQASAALEQGMVANAATSGTRAERQLEELRDEFRNRTSDQLAQEVRNLQQQAQKLDEEQQQLSRELADVDKPKQPTRSLRDTDHRAELGARLQQQQQRVDDVLERMRQTIENSTENEPLLTEQLYDTYRKAKQQDVSRSLRSAEWSLERGWLEDAKRNETAAAEAIRQLRQGVERAAESVLGDETESLRRAQRELRQLEKQLDQEIARAAPGGRPQEGPKDDSPQQNSSQQSSSGSQAQQQRPSDSQQANQADETQQANRPANQPQNSTRQAQDPSSQTPQSSNSQQPSNSQQQGSPSSRPSQSQSQSQQQNSDSPSQSPSSSQSPTPNQSGQPHQAGSAPTNGPRRLNDSPQDSPSRGGPQQLSNQPRTAGDDRPLSPIAGADFLQWSDRLRDVEEMLDDPALRAEARRVRDRARAIRKELKRHSQEPNWDLVKLEVLDPLAELQQRVSEELIRRTQKDALVPIDRDPVPQKYAEQVRRYYERLGRGN